MAINTNTKLIPVMIPFSDIDWERIELFRRRFQILWSNYDDLNFNKFSGTFSKAKDGSYSGSFSLPNEYRLKGLYADFRHFYLEKSQTNIRSFANYLSKLTDDSDYHNFIREEKKKLKSEFVDNGFFNLNGRHITTKELLDIYFNADLFHDDREKTKTLSEWTSILSDETVKSILYYAISDQIRVIKNVNWSATPIKSDNLFLRMPADYKENDAT